MAIATPLQDVGPSDYEAWGLDGLDSQLQLAKQSNQMYRVKTLEVVLEGSIGKRAAVMGGEGQYAY